MRIVHEPKDTAQPYRIMDGNTIVYFASTREAAEAQLAIELKEVK